MWKYIVKRILWVIPVLLGSSLLIFAMLHLAPGDPATTFLGTNATEEQIAGFNEKHGLDKPFLVQYLDYIKNIVTKFDFGNSYKNNISVWDNIKRAYPYTFKLALCAMAVAILIGIPLGIISAVKQYSLLDNVVSVLGLAGVSMPNFWLGLQLILLFSLKLHMLPSSGFDRFDQMIMPATALGLAEAANLMRTTRSSMLDVIKQDYIKTARAKGQKEIVVIGRHMLKNALLPIITAVAMQFAGTMGNSIVVEGIFSIPGMSQMLISSISSRDYVMVLGAVLVIAATCCVVNLLADLGYALVDPRLRAQYKSQRRKGEKKAEERKAPEHAK